MKRLAAGLLGLAMMSTALADERAFLSKAEVEQLALDKTWNMLRVADNQNVSWQLVSGGRLYAKNYSAGSSDSGKWLVTDSGQLCVKWRGNSTDRCVAVSRDGEQMKLVDSADPTGTYATLKGE